MDALFIAANLLHASPAQCTTFWFNIVCSRTTLDANTSDYHQEDTLKLNICLSNPLQGGLFFLLEIQHQRLNLRMAFLDM